MFINMNIINHNSDHMIVIVLISLTLLVLLQLSLLVAFVLLWILLELCVWILLIILIIVNIIIIMCSMIVHMFNKNNDIHVFICFISVGFLYNLWLSVVFLFLYFSIVFHRLVLFSLVVRSLFLMCSLGFGFLYFSFYLLYGFFCYTFRFSWCFIGLCCFH